MKHTRKLLVGFLLIISLLVFAGCERFRGSDESGEINETADTTDTTDTTDSTDGTEDSENANDVPGSDVDNNTDDTNDTTDSTDLSDNAGTTDTNNGTNGEAGGTTGGTTADKTGDTTEDDDTNVTDPEEPSLPSTGAKNDATGTSATGTAGDGTTSAGDISTGTSQTIREITITAKKWEFVPSTIKIKKGETVKFILTSTDVSHGFKIAEFGIEQTIEAGKTVTVQFTPDKTGTFTFICSVYCGEGHKDMKGTLIIE